MSVDERTRHPIHGRFEELLGPELASAFMSYRPPVGWADVATKRDLDALRTGLQLDLAGLRTELHRELGTLRGELHRGLGQPRGELHQGIGGLRGEVQHEVGGLRGELTDRMDRHFRTTIFALLGSNATMVALVFAAARLA